MKRIQAYLFDVKLSILRAGSVFFVVANSAAGQNHVGKPPVPFVQREFPPAKPVGLPFAEAEKDLSDWNEFLAAQNKRKK